MTEPPADSTDSASDRPFAWLEPAQPSKESAVAVPFEVQAYPMPAHNQTYPTQMYGRSLAEVYPPQPADDAPWPLVTGEPPRPRRRPSLALMLIIGLVVVLAGGATTAFILIGPASSRGTATPAAAVDGFLDAIYGKHSANDAARFVCERSRNDAELDQIVFGVKTFEQELTSPRTSWTYPAIEPDGPLATATVTLQMSTANEQVSRRRFELLLVNDRGWWVCDVHTLD